MSLKNTFRPSRNYKPMVHAEKKPSIELLMDQVMVIASIWTLASNDALEPSAKEKYKARVVLEQDHLRTMLQEALTSKD
ncbi:hypothetical protein [Comamonas testosteroni]|uniref:hypothetical protein n=1 Tax=Comamonas testosteroni TaxID=285 RepID=UPI0026F1E1D7|nr:hypothetical protein [Comamonas testosteroni]WQD45646.1 hypothetical protein U0024_13220 [Comamonas testosteroni]